MAASPWPVVPYNKNNKKQLLVAIKGLLEI